jgi:Cys-rich four helix bundle protein (predicted Tat secretion target)
MNRRSVLELMAATGIASAGTALAADQSAKPAEHEHYDHAAGSGKYAELIADASHCIDTGEACLAHCITLLGEGDRELAACARTVQSTITACTALRQLAAANSPRVASMARVVAEICEDCQAECHKNEQHAVCKACEDACVECAKECRSASA